MQPAIRRQARGPACAGRWRSWTRYLGVLGLTSGCGVYAGATTLVPSNGGKVEVAATTGYRLSVEGSSRGYVLGGFSMLGLRQSPAQRMGHGLLGLGFGYARMPIPIEPRVGFDSSLGLVSGWTSTSGEVRPAGGAYMDLGFPIRFTDSLRTWEIRARGVAAYGSLRPALQFVQLWQPGNAWTPESLFAASLTVHYDGWLLVEP